jgi:hypothetical protein
MLRLNNYCSASYFVLFSPAWQTHTHTSRCTIFCWKILYFIKENSSVIVYNRFMLLFWKALSVHQKIIKRMFVALYIIIQKDLFLSYAAILRISFCFFPLDRRTNTHTYKQTYNFCCKILYLIYCCSFPVNFALN